MFVHSFVDDAGFPLIEFRLVGHFSRRGVCFESIPNIAKVCRVSPRSVRRAIQSLVEKRVVYEERKPGATSIYRIRPTGDWICDRKPRGPRPTTTGVDPGQVLPGGPAQNDMGGGTTITDPPRTTTTDEGYPSEVPPLKAIQSRGKPAPKLFISELRTQQNLIDEELKQIALRGDFHGKPLSKDLARYKALKKKLREVKAEIIGIPCDTSPDDDKGEGNGLPTFHAPNRRNAGMGGDQTKRTAAIVGKVVAMQQKLHARTEAEREPQEEEINVPVLNDPINAKDWARELKEKLG